MDSDTIFASTLEKVDDFDFNTSVASVFDDMLHRSVPFYQEIQRMTVEMGRKFYQENTNVYDLGCSTGTTLKLFCEAIDDPGAQFVGYDTSQPMVDKATEKLTRANVIDRCRVYNEDIREAEMSNASIVSMMFTLQFIRPLFRDAMIKKIYDSLVDGGCFIMTEKVLGNETTLNRLFIELYYDFKRNNNYSELEITQKREALENVLIPYRIEENISILQRNGFELVEPFFRWYNFAGFVAIKHPAHKGL